MYRARLSGDLTGATLGYVSSMSDDAGLALYDILGSEAHVVMLHEQDIIPREDTAAILAALEALKGADMDAGTEAEDIHEYIEGEVIKRAGMERGGRMHAGRSRNDQVSLDMRMRIRDDINALCGHLAETVGIMLTVAGRHKSSVMPLYTHLQQAQVGTLSHYLLAQADMLFRDMDRLGTVYGRVNKSPLGAGPVGGTGIPVKRERTAELLGFDGLVENSIDATSSRDFVAEYVAALAILMTNLSRLSEDMVIWSSTEFAFIELPDELASPSSVMPQKKNPDILELTRAKAAEVIGNLTAVLTSVKGLATGYGRDLQQLKPIVWRTSETALHAAILVGAAVGGMTVNEENMVNAAKKGHLVALDIAEKLVLYKMPFRQAHRVVGLLVQSAVKRGKDLSDLTEQEIEQVLTGTGADPNMVFQITEWANISTSLKDRVSKGSPRLEEQERMIGDRVARVEAYQRDIVGRNSRIAISISELAATVAHLRE